MFGGRDEKGAKNSLYILRIGKKPVEWILANVAGTPPLPRYGHSMNYYPEKAILVVFGGRNDENFAKSGETYLSDIWILYLERLTWAEWDQREIDGPIPIARYSHATECFGSSVMILGGLSEYNYCKSDVYLLDLDGSSKKTSTVKNPDNEVKFAEPLVEEVPEKTENSNSSESKSVSNEEIKVASNSEVIPESILPEIKSENVKTENEEQTFIPIKLSKKNLEEVLENKSDSESKN